MFSMKNTKVETMFDDGIPYLLQIEHFMMHQLILIHWWNFQFHNFILHKNSMNGIADADVGLIYLNVFSWNNWFKLEGFENNYS